MGLRSRRWCTRKGRLPSSGHTIFPVNRNSPWRGRPTAAAPPASCSIGSVQSFRPVNSPAIVIEDAAPRRRPLVQPRAISIPTTTSLLTASAGWCLFVTLNTTPMLGHSALLTALTSVIASEKAYDVPEFCERLGLAPGTDAEAFRSKGVYAEKRLKSLPSEALVAAAKRAFELRPTSYELAEALRLVESGGRQRVSVLTRRDMLDAISVRGDMAGRLELVTFLSRVWSLDDMPSTDPRHQTAAGDIYRHMVLNSDWTDSYLFEHLNLMGCSDELFFSFLEQCVHPLVRDPDGQSEYLTLLNPHLAKDRLELRAVEEISGRPIYRVVPIGGVLGRPKNLIFASTGPKPDIVLRDAVNNDIEIARNAEFCLVYDRPFPAGPFLWRHLVEWWADCQQLPADDEQTRNGLYIRLCQSLASPPEKLLFRAYYSRLWPAIGEQLPALVPQVYLHYDPFTLRELRGETRLARQRMDFLLLLSSHERIVIEVDGKQHYAEGDTASPKRYAAMVAEDRKLRLSGYEVYRFGGAELTRNAGEQMVGEFFEALLQQHRILTKANDI